VARTTIRRRNSRLNPRACLARVFPLRQDMWLIPLLLLGGLVIRMMTPEERQRVLDHLVRAHQRFRQVVFTPSTDPDPFDQALRARCLWPAVTMALVAINVGVLVFVSGIAGAGDPETLLHSGASAGPLTTNGEWWRLLTAAFAHAGTLHLLVNLAGLVQIAIVVERLEGHAALALIYVAGGTLGTLVQLSAQPVTVTTASSAAVFGVYGAFLSAWMWGMLRPSAVSIPLRCLRRVGPAVGLFILYQLATGAMGWHSAAALLAGVVGGLLLSPGIASRQPSARQFAFPAAATAVAVIAMAIPLRGIIDVRPELVQVMELEQRTARTYEAEVGHFKNGRTSAVALAKQIEDKIVPELHAARERLNALRGVPPQHQHLVAAATEYLTLRDRSWRLRIAALQQGKTPLLREADQIERDLRDRLQSLATEIDVLEKS
jgi:membrane associated rhomboid family serine protease